MILNDFCFKLKMENCETLSKIFFQHRLLSLPPQLETLLLENNKVCDQVLSKLLSLLLDQLEGALSPPPPLQTLNLENNDLLSIPPNLAQLPSLHTLLVAGNPQRGVRPHVVQEGSRAVLEVLKNRLR